MIEERSPRRLAAILAADVVGYSRLMEQDEEGTLAALRSRRKDILQPLVERHQGRIFKFTGDGVLVEFGSAVNAVKCAIALQRDMAMANEQLQEDRQIVLRIGVNLGDVIVEGADLYGEGVNVAARLEGIANPGGIYVSGSAFDQVKTKAEAEFEDLGAQTLKNITEPVRVYRVIGAQSMSYSTSKVASARPCIAVLPFDNTSGDAEQQYFSDGITEDIITELSRFRTLVVIARNSSFQFRDKASDVRRVARELGAQYVLEGSVRKAGTLLRVTAQFVEGATGNHLWAERYDCSLEDVFRVQDDLVHRIVGRLEGRLAASLAEKARHTSAPNLVAYDFVLQARAQLNNQNGAAAAEPLLMRATELDPGYAQAYAWLAHTWMAKYFFDTRPEILAQAVEYGRMAVRLDEDDGQSHMALGNALVYQRQFEQAGTHLQRALTLNPSDALILGSYCHWLSRVGRIDEALAGLEDVVRRDPFPPAYIVETIAIAQIQAQRYTEAIKTIRGIREWQPWNYAYLAACYVALGDLSQAKAYAAETLKAMPNFSIRWEMLQEPYQNPDDTTRFEDMLRKAGFPE